jgi:hypothetical protein
MSKPRSTIQRTVLEEITSGKVRMRPRVFFTLLMIMGAVAATAASVVAAYLTSMAVFLLRISTASTPAYGARRNLADSFAKFPWWAVIVAAGLLLGGIVLLRKYGRFYRVRARSIALLFIAVTLVLGLVFFSLNIGHPSDGSNRHGNQPRISAS